MATKQIIAEGRMLKLGMWLDKQPLNPELNSKVEAVACFGKRLEEWVNSDNPHEVAPTFHLAPWVC